VRLIRLTAFAASTAGTTQPIVRTHPTRARAAIPSAQRRRRTPMTAPHRTSKPRLSDGSLHGRVRRVRRQDPVDRSFCSRLASSSWPSRRSRPHVSRRRAPVPRQSRCGRRSRSTRRSGDVRRGSGARSWSPATSSPDVTTGASADHQAPQSEPRSPSLSMSLRRLVLRKSVWDSVSRGTHGAMPSMRGR
jgi:hypothetical protein